MMQGVKTFPELITGLHLAATVYGRTSAQADVPPISPDLVPELTRGLHAAGLVFAVLDGQPDALETTRPEVFRALHDEFSPCHCGGVLAWEVNERRWVHVDAVCFEHAAQGDVSCPEDCRAVTLRCASARPVECARCETEVMVGGCLHCAETLCCGCCETAEECDDSDTAYDLDRERGW